MQLVFPLIVVFVLLLGLIKRVNIYDAMLAGAKEGLHVALHILPPMAVMLVAVRLFSMGGGMAALCDALAGVMGFVGLPREVVPLFLMRPLSGSGALAMLKEIFDAYGTDTRVGLIASAMMGSSETVFYTCAVYLGAAGVKKTRHAVACSLLTWVVGALVAVWLF